MLNVCAILCEMCCLCVMCLFGTMTYLIMYFAMLFSGPMTVSVQRGACHMCTDCGGPEIKS
jgi:hypothetical protein